MKILDFLCFALCLIALQADVGDLYAKGRRLQFDLICKGQGQTVKAWHPEAVGWAGYNGPAQWKEFSRYSFDLGRGLYAEHGLSGKQTSAIAGSIGYLVMLRQDREAVRTINLAKMEYYERGQLGTYKDGVTTARCRFARYSGVSS